VLLFLIGIIIDIRKDLRSLPIYDSSLAVGLNENVSKEFLRQSTQNFMADLSVLSLGERIGSPNQPRDDIISGMNASWNS
jgi:hypothetical protein